MKLVLDKARSLCLIAPKLLFGETRSFWKVPVPILLSSIKCWTRRKYHLMKSLVRTLRVSSRLRVIIILGSSYDSGNIWNLLPTRREKKLNGILDWIAAKGQAGKWMTTRTPFKCVTYLYYWILLTADAQAGWRVYLMDSILIWEKTHVLRLSCSRLSFFR